MPSALLLVQGIFPGGLLQLLSLPLHEMRNCMPLVLGRGRMSDVLGFLPDESDLHPRTHSLCERSCSPYPAPQLTLSTVSSNSRKLSCYWQRQQKSDSAAQSRHGLKDNIPLQRSAAFWVSALPKPAGSQPWAGAAPRKDTAAVPG